ncbi:MAG: hypothetical protein DMG15_02075 [Acidobacteria bacterium]|nr:MAG: hypothetical protein DMG16_27755 [Acidobacteriota bacterium]PYS16471.1 MAG: hypothetical protein DMG15_02075 [Acidobacteriota bacterium]
MNLAHIHLLLNHFPTVGFAIGLGLLVLAITSKKDELKRASLVVVFLVALITIPTYLSGNAAQSALQERTDLSQAAIRAHEGAAFWGYLFMEITGFIAWLGLWYFRIVKRVANWNVAAVFVLGVLTFSVMTRAANLGGEIRHPEIQSAGALADNANVPDIARSIGLFVNGHSWVWPTCETLHFIGLSLLFTVVLIVDLRLLGMAKKFSFAALYQLLPLGILGFSMNLVTGMLFFIASPEQYVKNVSFHWKILFVMLAGINALYFMLVEEPWAIGPGDDAPAFAKFAAASAIFLWVGVLFFGHMLPFLGNSF